MAGELLLLTLVVLWSVRRYETSPPANPKRPFHANCYVVISEIRPFRNDKPDMQFIELTRTCQNPSQNKLTTDMLHFRVVVIDANRGEIITFCKPKGRMLPRPEDKSSQFYVFGGKDVDKVNIELKQPDCLFSEEYALPSGISENSMYAVALLYNRGDFFYDEIKLNIRDGRAQPTAIAFYNVRKMKSSIQDLVLYGNNAPGPMPAILRDIQEIYTTSENCLLHDPLKNVDASLSYSRCAEAWTPFQAKTFYVSQATPGTTNECLRVQALFHGQLLPFAHSTFVTNQPTPTATIPAHQQRPTEDVVTPQQRPSATIATPQQRPVATMLTLRPFPTMIVDTPEPGTAATIVAITQTPAATGPQATISPQLPQRLSDETLDLIETHQGHAVDTSTLRQPRIRAWVEWVYNEDDPGKSKFRCRYCHHILEHEVVTEWKGSQFRQGFPSQDGMKPKTGRSAQELNNLLLQDHLNNPIHAISEVYFHEKDIGEDDDTIFAVLMDDNSPFRIFYRATENLFRTVLSAVKMRVPFRSFPTIVQLLHHFGVALGKHFLGRTGVHDIVLHIGDEVHKALIAYLLEQQLEVSVSADASSDIAKLENLNVELRFVTDDLVVYSFFYAFLPIGVDGRGVKLFELLQRAFQDDGIAELVREKLVCVSSDNAAVMVNQFYGAIQQWIPERNIFHVPCYLHRNELAMKHAYLESEFVILIDHVLNSLYSYYHMSSKSTAHLLGTQLDEADTRFHLHRLYKIRWVSSRYRTCSTFISHFQTIATDLRSISQDTAFSADSRGSAQTLYTNITDRTFLTHTAFMADISGIFQTLSLYNQMRCSSLSGQKRMRDELTRDLRRLKTTNGYHLRSVIRESICDSEPCTLQRFETAKIVRMDDLEIKHNIPEAKPPQMLTRQRTVIVDNILRWLQFYYDDVIHFDFDIIDQNQVGAHSVEENLLPKLRRLNERFQFTNDERDFVVLTADFIAVLNSVQRHPLYRMNRDLPVQYFWEKFARERRIPWTVAVKRVFRILLHANAGIAECERNFSLYNMERTRQRFSMDRRVAEALVRIRRNTNEFISEKDLINYVRSWCSKHMRSDDPQESRLRFEDPAEERLNVPF